MIDLETLAAEGESEPFRFNWAGDTYEMPTFAQLPWTVVDQVMAGQASTERLRLIMGDEQFERFKAKPCPAGKLKALMDLYWAHMGVDAGES